IQNRAVSARYHLLLGLWRDWKQELHYIGLGDVWVFSCTCSNLLPTRAPMLHGSQNKLRENMLSTKQERADCLVRSCFNSEKSGSANLLPAAIHCDKNGPGWEFNT